MGEKEKEFLLDAFNSNWIAPLGPHVDAFEQEMAEYLGIGHAAALNTGTAALHLALKLVGVKDGDTVLCPSLTFSACANVILYANATPVFLDVDNDSWTLNPEALKIAIKKYQPKAIIAVDLYGQSADYNAILELCKVHDVAVIEDAAEALGSEYKGKKCGTFGRMGVLSFNGNKIITTSGGGMLVSNNKDFVEKARFLSTQAREPGIYYEHKKLGYNYRMSNLLAAVGRGQLQVLDERMQTRRKIFQRYFDALVQIDGIKFMPEAPYGKTNRWLTTLTVDPQKIGINRNQIITALEKENIEARPAWKPMHLQPLFKDYEYITQNDKDVSGKLFDQGLCLPSGSSLTEKEQNKVIDIILDITKSA